MFGIDFSELIVILAVALIVVGPERLPKVARTFGHLWGRLQRYIHTVKTDIAREMAAEEFRQLQQKINQEVMSAEREAHRAVQGISAQAPDAAQADAGAGTRQAQTGLDPEQKKS
ncbi:MAG: twin-arginine translocase subunit TatB [Nitrosomonadales bacterium]|nr:twin-arginine translocase subunit TatB [Nitrosomonadales bacterium]